METKSVINLNFIGPFTFTGPKNSLFHAPCAKSPGIYLWTIRQPNDNSYLIHYVGETTNFAKRHREHLIHILGLNYGIFDPIKAQNGVCELVWRGLWRDKSPDGPLRQIEAYHSLHETVLHYLSVINVFFAEIEIETRLRKHIEGCIGWNLRNNHPEAKSLYPDDNQVGTMKEKNRGELVISSNENIQGLDRHIQY
jgi:hypothetical protein